MNDDDGVESANDDGVELTDGDGVEPVGEEVESVDNGVNMDNGMS